MELFVVYIYWINIITFLLCALNHRLIVLSKPHIPQAIFWILSFIGGAFATLCQLLIFRRHNTNLAYKIVVPILFVAWVVCCAILFSK
jgi:uncharacterized membrane protein YsdA (DUF1294 family)